ncbi:hypothetical protein Lalb_Chr25g0282811 [Lupinus albus]|uniref:Uncharacterized protein n=1 Tax=Lupinus albus TaxID=3870 RepID=A0A6A4N7G5_LUPAL|nr:hypothetical protein Lalb_Chr25g0282811 [Lupinus albus]
MVAGVVLVGGAIHFVVVRVLGLLTSVTQTGELRYSGTRGEDMGGQGVRFGTRLAETQKKI